MAFIPDEACRKFGDLTPSARLLYTYHCMRRNHDTKLSAATLAEFRSDYGMSRSQAYAAQQELYTARWISGEEGSVRLLVGSFKPVDSSAEVRKTGQAKSPKNRTAEEAPKPEQNESAVSEKPDSSELPDSKLSEFSDKSEKPDNILSEKSDSLIRNTSSNEIPSPFANAQGETATRGAPSRRQESAASKLDEDEREVLEAWRDLAKAYPPEAAWPTILERLKVGFDRVRFKRCGGAYLAYYGKGQRHIGGILDWYDENLTAPRAQEKNGNGLRQGQNGQHQRGVSVSPRSERQNRNATALIQHAAQLAASDVRGGGKPPDS